MQITNAEKTVTRSHVFEEGTFLIEANSIMFEILSSKIYTDVPFAIVRELSTNAADAHIDAGTQDQPFDIHLPTTWEPYFSIRDYGTGISCEDIDTVYKVFGSSTRRQSDDFTGCLGLGSKTPFAYADQFTVSSFQNGVKRDYSAFKNEDNLPAISLMGTSDTDQPDGLEIHLNIRPEDINRFQNAAGKVYQHFPVRPNIKGIDLEFDDMEPIMEGEGWKLYDRSGHLPAKVSVLMGKICYAADGGEIEHELGDGVYLFLEVRIGDCSIAASREELQYNDHTNTSLQRLVNEAMASIRVQIDNKIDNADCQLTQAIARLKYRHIITLPNGSASFKLNVTDRDGINPQFDDLDMEPKVLYGMWGLETRRNGTQLVIDRSIEYIRPCNSWKSKGYIFIENDLPEGEQIRAMHKRKIRNWIMAEDAHAYLVTINDRDAYTKVFGEPTIKLTELPDVPRETVITNGGNRVAPSRIKQLRTTQQRRKNFEWTNLEDEIDGGVCVPRKGYRVIFGGQEHDANFAREVGRLVGCETIYGLSHSSFAKLAASTGLDNLEDKARVWIQQYVDNASPAVLNMLANDNGTYYRGNIHNHIDSGIMKALEPGMSDVIDAVFGHRDEIAPTNTHRTLIRQFAIDVPPSAIESVESVATRFYDRYPLLKHIHSYRVDKDPIVGYIEMIEASLAS